MFLRGDTHRLYHDLAWVYDAIYPQIFDYRAVYDALKPVLEEKKVESILEAACGTGTSNCVHDHDTRAQRPPEPRARKIR